MPRYERLVNDVETTLNGAINDTVTTITVDDGSVFPATGDYRVKIENEVCLVTARSTNDLTVIRGVDGTTAASHTTGRDVRVLATKSQWDKFIDDKLAGGSVNPPHLIADSAGDPVVASDFSWVNQGSATLSDTPYGGLTMFIPFASGVDMRLAYISAPSAPWVFTGHITFGPGYVSSGSDFCGFIIREASSANFYIWRMTPGNNLVIQRFTSPTSAATTLFNEKLSDNRCWLQIEDDNTDLFFRHSYDGKEWFTAFTHSRTTYFSTGPDQIGLMGNGGSNAWYMHTTSFLFE